MLKSLGARAVFAATGEEGARLLRKADQGEDPFRLVLLDTSLGGENAFEVSEQMRRVSSLGDRILMMTAAPAVGDDFARCVGLGFSDCLTKPVGRSRLAEAVLRAVGAHPGSAVERGARPPRTEVEATAKGDRALLAEDDVTNRVFVATLLRRSGWEVTEVANGRLAVDALESGSFDLVLMDVQMPEMDGPEATRRIRSAEAVSGEHVPIIGITAHARKKDEEACLAAGMDGYLSKPVDPDALFRLIGRHLAPTAASSRPAVGEPADLSAVIHGLNGDPEAVQSLVDHFLDSYPSTVEDLRGALEAGNAEQSGRAAHRLKGSILIFKAERAARLTETLENLGDGGKLDGAPPLLAELEKELERVAEFLDRAARSLTGNDETCGPIPK
jgi:CheY-like chemotaxis protein